MWGDACRHLDLNEAPLVSHLSDLYPITKSQASHFISLIMAKRYPTGAIKTIYAQKLRLVACQADEKYSRDMGYLYFLHSIIA